MDSIILVFIASVAKSQEGEECPTNKKKKKRLLDSLHLASNCPRKHVIEGKIEGRIKVTRRRGRRHKQLLDDLQ